MAGRLPRFAYQGGEPTLMGLDYFRRSVELQMRLGRGQTVGDSIQTNGILKTRNGAFPGA